MNGDFTGMVSRTRTMGRSVESGALPSNSSPAVSLEGATLMHRLVNLERDSGEQVNSLSTPSQHNALMEWEAYVVIPDGLTGGFVFHS